LILLDTHVLVWAVSQPKKLSRAADAAIRRARIGGGIGIASITLWELAVLISRGHIGAPGTIDNSIQTIVETIGASIRPLTPEIAALATQFPEDFSHDPADRLIGATARSEGLTLVTRDEKIRSSRLLRTIW
jgi:PIN domain nuclease of toxin-antitoxin system